MGKITSLFAPALLLLAASCFDPGPQFIEVQQVTGYVPEYGSDDVTQIVMKAPRTVNAPGKIYVYGNYLLVNEKRQGIHVFDNADPATPVNLGFLQLLGNTDMAIKDSVLYADHMGNLVALTIKDLESIEEKGRLPLRDWVRGVPPPPGFYFVCVDPEKGFVVNWREAELTNPQCYALR